VGLRPVTAGPALPGAPVAPAPSPFFGSTTHRAFFVEPAPADAAAARGTVPRGAIPYGPGAPPLAGVTAYRAAYTPPLGDAAAAAAPWEAAAAAFLASGRGGRAGGGRPRDGRAEPLPPRAPGAALADRTASRDAFGGYDAAAAAAARPASAARVGSGAAPRVPFFAGTSTTREVHTALPGARRAPCLPPGAGEGFVPVPDVPGRLASTAALAFTAHPPAAAGPATCPAGRLPAPPGEDAAPGAWVDLGAAAGRHVLYDTSARAWAAPGGRAPPPAKAGVDLLGLGTSAVALSRASRDAEAAGATARR